MELDDQLTAVDLTELERNMLCIGLFDWAGPAYCGNPLAQAIGFRDLQDLYNEGQRIVEDLRRERPLLRRDWTRALASLEVMLTSSLGSGEWGAIHGYEEDELHRALRALRKKLPTARGYLDPHANIWTRWGQSDA